MLHLQIDMSEPQTLHGVRKDTRPCAGLDGLRRLEASAVLGLGVGRVSSKNHGRMAKRTLYMLGSISSLNLSCVTNISTILTDEFIHRVELDNDNYPVCPVNFNRQSPLRRSVSVTQKCSKNRYQTEAQIYGNI
jgi:hypothetical protein